MDNRRENIYSYLSKLTVFSKKEYDFLVKRYGKIMVDSTIDLLIDEDEKNASKFSYYIELMNITDNINMLPIDIYLNDILKIPVISKDDNKKYACQVYNIIEKMRSIFVKFDCKYIYHNDYLFNSIIDEVEYYVSICCNKEIECQLKSLLSEFIVLRDKLIEGNLRLVIYALKYICKDRKTFLECIQYGNIGLMRAIEKFDPRFCTAFSTYAYYWIRHTYRTMEKQELNTGTSVSYNALEKNNLRLKIISQLTTELGRYPNSFEIAECMGISVKKLKELEQNFLESVSIYSPILISNDDDKSIRIIDTIADDKSIVENNFFSVELKDELNKIIEELLDEKQKYIIMNRFGLNGDAKTLQQIGCELGVSRQFVEQIQAKALTKIKRVAGKKLSVYLN